MWFDLLLEPVMSSLLPFGPSEGRAENGNASAPLRSPAYALDESRFSGQLAMLLQGHGSSHSLSAVNEFNHPLFSVREAIADPEVLGIAIDVLSLGLEFISGTDYRQKISNLFEQFKGAITLAPSGEQAWTSVLDAFGGIENARGLLAHRMVDLDQTFRACWADQNLLPRGLTLDLGCGNGIASRNFCQMAPEVTSLVLADICDYRSAEAVDTPFILLDREGSLPFRDGCFDSVLVVTVLHHSKTPRALLAEAVRVCKDRIFIVESIVGSSVFSTVERFPAQAGRTWETMKEIERRFLELSLEQQMKHASIHDWLVNFAAHGWIEAPMNFGTDADWKKAFSELGLRLKNRTLVGFDQITAPECHVLYVCEK